MNIVDRTTQLLSQFPEIEVLKVTPEGPDEYTALFRVLDSAGWTRLVGELLKVEEVLGGDSPFVLHLCRQYVRHGGQLRHVASMSVRGSKGLEEALGGLCALLEEIQQEKAEEQKTEGPPLKKAPQTKKAVPKAEQPQLPPGAPMVQIVPLNRSTADRNKPNAGLWKSGSKGAHLIKGHQQ